MKKILYAITLCAICTFSFVGGSNDAHALFGRTKPIYNVTDAPISSYSGEAHSADSVEKAILTGSRAKGWNVKKLGDGQIEAWILVRGKHTAKIDITFTSEKYSITYKDSVNLRYDAEKQTIHRNYNKWIKLLEQSINNALNTM